MENKLDNPITVPPKKDCGCKQKQQMVDLQENTQQLNDRIQESQDKPKALAPPETNAPIVEEQPKEQAPKTPADYIIDVIEFVKKSVSRVFIGVLALIAGVILTPLLIIYAVFSGLSGQNAKIKMPIMLFTKKEKDESSEQ